MERYRTRNLLLALTAASGLLLTACSGGADSSGDRKAADRDGYSAPSRGDELSEQEDDRRENPRHLSTFALDVDTASYDYARRALADGRFPDPSTVRPEEFVNSFRQDYERPDGDGFSVTVDGARTDDEDWSLV
ncbi:VWA domain-containing protein, partial [Streptomyces purpurascens]